MTHCSYRTYYPQSYMDSEIRAIMAQYMPLESQEMPNQHRPVVPVDHADI